MSRAHVTLTLAAALTLALAAECPDLYKRASQPSVPIDTFPYSFDFEDLQRYVIFVLSSLELL
jgi:hypothetical protein